MTKHNPYRAAATTLFLSAALIILGPILGAPVGFLVVALAMAIVALGMMRGLRWVAYSAFLLTGFTGAIVLGWIWGIGGPPIWWAITTTAACWLAAVLLLAVLWRAKGGPDPA